ncbi:hypothetical protein PDESU_00514 [Pontiella desulfatans]|uniref:Uncharacterized protein n=1 Tax=Pontiella desulfatans TaxID=2750659 RepID=A0A6C2TXI6_PONDE|nr:hypothetical protein [Pontiella desulfatans]VGO11966.1 hypothetical protein PDESU_00514 [Pontiella desulfatans]
MKRGFVALLAAVFLVGAGTARGQVFVYDSENNDYVTANKNFVATPTSWQNYESAPASGYTGPSFSYAGVNSESAKPATARFLANDRMQINDNTNFHYMVAFDFPASKVKTITTQGSTYGAGVAGDDTYLILHDSTQGPADGWYATLLHSRTTVSTFEYTVEVADATWYTFTPSTVNGTVPLGTIGSVVDVSIITGGTFDEAGYYANVYDNGLGVLSHYLWSLAVYEPVTTLFLNPSDQITMDFSDAAAVVSNSIAVSYSEGVPPTNVNVSSVSLINPSHAGFAVSPGSFMLTDPDPSNRMVSVVFDNGVAGLSANESATGTVQVIWNEMGSASSSTSTVAVSATRLGFAANKVIAIFEDGPFRSPANGGWADVSFSGVDALITGIPWGNSDSGSDDTSYGTLLGGAQTRGGTFIVINGNPDPTVIITNNTGGELELDSLNFDAARKWAASMDAVTVSMSGDLGSATLLSHTGLVQVSNIGNYSDFDIDLTGLADRKLSDGESVAFTFAFADGGLGTGYAVLDNIAIIGSGFAPATMSRISPYPWESLGASGLDTTVSQTIDLMYAVGDLNTNIVVTGVSFANEDVPGAFSAIGSFPLALPTPGVTNSAVFSLVFDNSVANLAPGTWAYSEVVVEFEEPGGGPRTYSFDAYGTRPDDVPTNGIVALFHTEFLTPDAAYNGVMGRFEGGFGLESTTDKGSLDGTYGSLTAPFASTNSATTWRFEGVNPVATLTITNRTVAAIELTGFHFDIGRWYDGATNFMVSISGDVTSVPALLEGSLVSLGWRNNDFQDYDVDLTGLADHTLAAGESVIFTYTLGAISAGQENIGTWIDNIALMGTADAFGGWAASEGLTVGVNDALHDNPDFDSKDNLMEYATGGNPLVADESAAAMWQAEDSGTNWLYHVHAERQDDTSLTYGVGTKGNLQYEPSWNSGDVEQVGATTGPGLWKTVTNRTDMGAAAKFIGLSVEQN